MSKYDRLGQHLRGLDRSTSHTISFDRIEAILGFRLPDSAHNYQAWWANQKNGRHVQANQWLDAGWHTEDLSLKGRVVTFRPVGTPRAPRTAAVAPMTIDAAKSAIAKKYGIRPDQVEVTIRA